MPYALYTTNSKERSAAANERSTSESDLESSVECHRVLTEQWSSKSVECLASARWDSTGDSKSLLLGERLLAAAERSMGLVVYRKTLEFCQFDGIPKYPMVCHVLF